MGGGRLYTHSTMTLCPSCGFQNAERVKFCAECGSPLAGAAQPAESRRTVTILFADVSGSTSLGEQLDPESLRALMGRYFTAMQAIIERHGGTVEKFIGDAVMAVFGIPVLHEDDALRAVRAAADIGERLAALNADLGAERGIAIRFRTGVNTGEVVAGDPASGQTLVTGDAVNTAARLEQAATPGEIVIGPLTYQLVRDAVEVEQLEPLSLKGKAQPLRAYRLIRVTPGAAGHARRLDAPLVGREAELARLQAAFGEALTERRSELVTVLGAAGVGKSRLVTEFQASLAGRARLLTGRCLPYGEGITYWPIAEVVRSAAGIEEGDNREAAIARLQALAATAPEASVVTERVAQAIGLAAGSAPAEEIFWAVRKLFETLARTQPLVIEFDDIQWADDAFLDLLEHVLTLAHDTPLLLVCPARPELLERSPGWGSGWPQAITLRLEPLGAASAGQLIDHLPGGSALPAALRTRILDAAEGNPLVVEEMLGMLVDEGHLQLAEDGSWRASGDLEEVHLPPTIAALLAARLDQLAPGERALAQRASVVGQSFEQAALVELLPAGQRGGLSRDLLALVRKEMIRPDRSVLSAGDAYRFRHLLIRDAAYDALPKAERADLHARFAAWLERATGDRAQEYQEIIGYHLEQAHHYRIDLGLLDPSTTALAERAASHLAGAGLRAYDRIDWAATANLLTRAATLLPRADPQRVAFLPRLGRTLLRLGRFDDAQAALDEVIEATADGSNPAARVFALWVRPGLALLKGATQEEIKPDVDEALAIAEATGDPAQLAYAHGGLAGLAYGTGRLREARRELELAFDAAQRSGDPNLEAEARISLAEVKTEGPALAAEIDQVLADTLAWARDHGRRRMEAGVLRIQATEAASRGRIPEARRLLAECTGIFEEVGALLVLASTIPWDRANLEFLAGDPVARERVLREGYEQLSAMGERGNLSNFAADLADALVDLGRLDEAESMFSVAAEAGAVDDVWTQVSVRLGRGRLAAARGNMDEALTSVAGGLALADEGEYYALRMGSRLVLAQLLLDAGRTGDARARAQEVLDLARPGRDVVLKARARDLMHRAAAPKSDSRQV
jgi:class 3 adenylate cyclase/tetratricopeptide (TPR) repeat protein